MIDRRTLLTLPVALSACGREASSQPAGGAAASLRAAPFPIGASVMTGHLGDPGFVGLVRRHISQLTPEWEMKMEYILPPGGGLRFDAPDAIAAFARAEGLKLFGHALVWYAQDGEMFQRLKDDPRAFAGAYRDYIVAVAGRYAGLARGWDVVNEPVNEDGSGLRDSRWSQVLGETDHIVRAFDHAAEADPAAALFLNDYNLENLPRKRARFMRLVETLLARGCRIGGLGTQTHVDIDLPAGAAGAALRDLASFGLPIHLSELDISTHMKRVDLRTGAERLRLQAKTASDIAEAYMALPPAQRFGFTLWGLRDKDSWLRGPNGTGPGDQPSLFDDAGRPKPAYEAVARVFAG